MSKSYYENYWKGGDAPPESDPLTPKRIDCFLEFIKGKEIKNILDFGCGSGLVSNKLSEAGYNVTGVDISENAIEEAKNKYPSINFAAASFDDKLPFENGQFDAIYCAEVIEHIYGVEALVQELNRILKNDGLIFISTPYHGFIKNLIITLFGFSKHFDIIGAHIRFFTKKPLYDLLTKYGFKVERIKYLGRFWPVWMDMLFTAIKIKNNL